MTISYTQGQVGGLMQWIKTLKSPASLLEQIELDVTLEQRTPPANTDQDSHAYGLLTSRTQGPFTLTHATITGTFDHAITSESAKTSMGAVAGRTTDVVRQEDMSTSASGLRALKTLLSDVKVHDVEMPRCKVNPSQCDEVGGLFGRMGRDSGADNMTEYSHTPIELQDVEISDNDISGVHAATIVGIRQNADLKLTRVSIHGNAVSASGQTNGGRSCLVHSTASELTMTELEEVCATTTGSQCSANPDLQLCDGGGFDSAPWRADTRPPELLR